MIFIINKIDKHLMARATNRYRATFGINKKGSRVRVPAFSVLAVVNEEGQRRSDRKHSDEWNQFTELASSLFYFFLSHGPIDLPFLSYRYRTTLAHRHSLNDLVNVVYQTFFPSLLSVCICPFMTK